MVGRLVKRESRKKIVVAPDMWFTPHYKLDYSDVVPEEWIKLNTGYFESKEF